MFASLLANISNIKYVNVAYKHILTDNKKIIRFCNDFLKLDIISQKYRNLTNINFIENIKEFTKIALDKKFQDRENKILLVETGNSKLLWNDYSDPILGIGDKRKNQKGENFVGKYLEELRKFYSTKIKLDKKLILKIDNIDKVIESDIFIKKWIESRTKDICETIMIMKDYVFNKHNIDTKGLPKDFVESSINNIYKNCNNLVILTDESMKTPKIYKNIVQSNYGFKDASKEIVDLLWKRISSLLLVLLKFMKNKNITNVKTVLKMSIKLVSNNKNCIRIIKDNLDNCILSAIINISKNILKFNSVNGKKNNMLTKKEIDTSLFIILGRNNTQNIIDYGDDIVDNFNEDIDEQDIEEEEEDDDIDYGDVDDDTEYFSFKDEEENIIVEKELKNIFGKLEDNILPYLQESIEKIKLNQDIDAEKKMNRINFFSSQN